jgi:hypothetical protein
MSYFIIPSTMRKVSGVVAEFSSELVVLVTETEEIHAVPEKFPRDIKKGDMVEGRLHSYEGERILSYASKSPVYITI